MKVPIQFGASSALLYAGAGTNNTICSNAGNLYQIYVEANLDLVYKKSTDDGITWSVPVPVYVGSVVAVATWYGRWSDRADDKIYIAYTESTTDDILFRTIDTGSSDTLGTQTVVFAGTSTANGGCLSIVIAKGGNIIVAGYIDAGAEGGAWKSTDSGATWGAAIANPMEAVSTDMIFLCPGFNSDTQDIMGIFQDASANELSVKRYDDSANSWTETSISTSIIDAIATVAFPFMNIVSDVTNSQVVVVAWSETDAANQDLRCWTVTWSAITAKTDVVTNATDDCQNCAISINTDTGIWTAFWGGNPDGSETLSTIVNVWYSKSTNTGTTWSTPTKLTTMTYPIRTLIGCPRCMAGPNYWPISWGVQHTSGEVELFTMVELFTRSGGTIISS
jgi:hypothetical protein